MLSQVNTAGLASPQRTYDCFLESVVHNVMVVAELIRGIGTEKYSEDLFR